MSDYISKQEEIECPISKMEKEHEQAYWAREGLIKKLEGEAARLLEALVLIEDESSHDDACITKINGLAQDALKGDTEPVGVQRIREQFQAHSNDESYQAGVRDAISCLGITIPGINTGEGKA